MTPKRIKNKIRLMDKTNQMVILGVGDKWMYSTIKQVWREKGTGRTTGKLLSTNCPVEFDPHTNTWSEIQKAA